MDLKINEKKVVVFDLDDTLYKEIDFLKSAFKEIASYLVEDDWGSLFKKMLELYHKDRDVFENIISTSTFSHIKKNDLIEKYRTHIPNITLSSVKEEALIYFKENAFAVCLLTDGRSRTQRNKLKSLGISNSFDEILISEEFGSTKPNKKNYLYFEERYPSKKFIYIGDNIIKDFITANQLGWKTICLLDDGRNIHSQDIEVDKEFLPDIYIKSFKELFGLS